MSSDVNLGRSAEPQSYTIGAAGGNESSASNTSITSDESFSGDNLSSQLSPATPLFDSKTPTLSGQERLFAHTPSDDTLSVSNEGTDGDTRDQEPQPNLQGKSHNGLFGPDFQRKERLLPEKLEITEPQYVNPPDDIIQRTISPTGNKILDPVYWLLSPNATLSHEETLDIVETIGLSPTAIESARDAYHSGVNVLLLPFEMPGYWGLVHPLFPNTVFLSSDVKDDRHLFVSVLVHELHHLQIPENFKDKYLSGPELFGDAMIRAETLAHLQQLAVAHEIKENGQSEDDIGGFYAIEMSLDFEKYIESGQNHENFHEIYKKVKSFLEILYKKNRIEQEKIYKIIEYIISSFRSQSLLN
ncbi:MAG: hypothetical protein AAFW47_06215 [Pseudomonadota bacterium]